MATTNSSRLAVPEVLQARVLEQSRHGHENHGREDGLRKSAQQVGKEKDDDQDEPRRHNSGKWRVSTAQLVHQ